MQRFNGDIVLIHYEVLIKGYLYAIICGMLLVSLTDLIERYERITWINIGQMCANYCIVIYFILRVKCEITDLIILNLCFYCQCMNFEEIYEMRRFNH